jgi:hypothetical protein
MQRDKGAMTQRNISLKIIRLPLGSDQILLLSFIDLIPFTQRGKGEVTQRNISPKKVRLPLGFRSNLTVFFYDLIPFTQRGEGTMTHRNISLKKLLYAIFVSLQLILKIFLKKFSKYIQQMIEESTPIIDPAKTSSIKCCPKYIRL